MEIIYTAWFYYINDIGNRVDLVTDQDVGTSTTEDVSKKTILSTTDVLVSNDSKHKWTETLVTGTLNIEQGFSDLFKINLPSSITIPIIDVNDGTAPWGLKTLYSVIKEKMKEYQTTTSTIEYEEDDSEVATIEQINLNSVFVEVSYQIKGSSNVLNTYNFIVTTLKRQIYLTEVTCDIKDVKRFQQIYPKQKFKSLHLSGNEYKVYGLDISKLSTSTSTPNNNYVFSGNTEFKFSYLYYGTYNANQAESADNTSFEDIIIPIARGNGIRKVPFHLFQGSDNFYLHKAFFNEANEKKIEAYSVADEDERKDKPYLTPVENPGVYIYIGPEITETPQDNAVTITEQSVNGIQVPWKTDSEWKNFNWLPYIYSVYRNGALTYSSNDESLGTKRLKYMNNIYVPDPTEIMLGIIELDVGETTNIQKKYFSCIIFPREQAKATIECGMFIKPYLANLANNPYNYHYPATYELYYLLESLGIDVISDTASFSVIFNEDCAALYNEEISLESYIQELLMLSKGNLYYSNGWKISKDLYSTNSYIDVNDSKDTVEITSLSEKEYPAKVILKFNEYEEFERINLIGQDEIFENRFLSTASPSTYKRLLGYLKGRYLNTSEISLTIYLDDNNINDYISNDTFKITFNSIIRVTSSAYSLNNVLFKVTKITHNSNYIELEGVEYNKTDWEKLSTKTIDNFSLYDYSATAPIEPESITTNDGTVDSKLNSTSLIVNVKPFATTKNYKDCIIILELLNEDPANPDFESTIRVIGIHQAIVSYENKKTDNTYTAYFSNLPYDTYYRVTSYFRNEQGLLGAQKEYING